MKLIWINPTSGVYTPSAVDIPTDSTVTEVLAVGQQQTVTDASTLGWWSGIAVPNLTGDLGGLRTRFVR